MKILQQFIVLFFTALALLVADNAKATHAMAGYITYSYVSANTYELTLTFYRDCSGVNAPQATTINYTSSCGGGGSVTLNQVPGTGQPIALSPFSVPANTTCMGGINYGVQEWKYSGTVLLPIACSDWTFSYSLCCRNTNNTTSTPGDNLYFETKLNNLVTPINSSPVPINHVVAEFCVGDPAIWNQSSTDADGDSLVYSLVCPKISGTANVSYIPPYSCTNPIIASPPISYNPTSGQMAFLPTVQHSTILATKVEEYRGGVLIGSVVNSMQVYVVNYNLCVFTNSNVNLIYGKSFIDSNQNGICDSNEVGFTDGLVSFTDQSTTNYTGIGNTGLFFGVVDTGSWTTSVAPFNPNYFSVSPDSIISNFGSQTGQIDTIDFAVQLISGYPDLSIELNSIFPPVPGFHLWYNLVAKNIGTDTITGDVQFTHDSLLMLNFAYPNYSSYANSTFTWNFTNFAPFETQTYSVLLNVPVPPIVNMGDTMNSSVIINPVATDINPSNNIDSKSQIVLSSFDPNDKWVNDETVLSSELPYTDHLEYLIRFQNTGTDTAHRVIIRDTLDHQLDQSTLQITSASHDYILIKRSNNVLEFQFNNILLPDSNVNEALSHGYIAYQIKPKSTFAVGNVISNRAAIYFDYNLPVLTNVVTTEAVLFTSVIETIGALPLHVYPNPTSGKITVSAKDLDFKNATIKIYNTLGQLAYNEKIYNANALKYTIDVSALKSGVYELVVTESKKMFSAKIIIEN